MFGTIAPDEAEAALVAPTKKEDEAPEVELTKLQIAQQRLEAEVREGGLPIDPKGEPLPAIGVGSEGSSSGSSSSEHQDDNLTCGP